MKAAVVATTSDRALSCTIVLSCVTFKHSEAKRCRESIDADNDVFSLRHIPYVELNSDLLEPINLPFC